MSFLLQVRTNGNKPPAGAVKGALQDLHEEIFNLRQQFKDQAAVMEKLN
jgi:hypothetical protein